MNSITYNGILHNFTFVEENGNAVVTVYDKAGANPLSGLILVFPNMIATKKLPPMKQIYHMLHNGFYPLIQGQIITFQQGLSGGMKKAAASDISTQRKWAESITNTHTLKGHTARITCLIHLKKSSVLVSGSDDYTINLWDPNTGKCLHTLEGHTDKITVVIELKNGTLASGSDDKTVKLWDPNTGKCLHTIELKDICIELIELKDGTIAIGFYGSETIMLWDPNTRKCLRMLEGLFSLIELKDGSLASGFHDGTIKIRDPHTGKCLHTLEGHEKRIWFLIELKDGTLASGSKDGTIKLWDPHTGKCLHTLEGHSRGITALIQLKDGTLACGFKDGADGAIKLWDPHTGKSLRNLEGHIDFISFLIELKNGALVSGSDDRTIKIWDPDTGECLCTLRGHKELIRLLIELKDGTIATGSHDGTIKIWKGDVKAIKPSEVASSTTSFNNAMPSLPNNERKEQQQKTEPPQKKVVVKVPSRLALPKKPELLQPGVVFSSTSTSTQTKVTSSTASAGSVIASLPINGQEQLKQKSGQLQHQAVSNQHSVLVLQGKVEINPILEISTNRNWIKSIRNTFIFKDHTDVITSLIQLNNSTILVSGSGDKTVKLWNPHTGKCIRTLEEHEDKIRSLVELKNGNLASGADNGIIKLWNPDTGKCFRTLEDHTRKITALIALKDGSLASASNDGSIRIWDPNTGKCLQIFRFDGDRDCDTPIELKDGTIAGGVDDYETIKLWDPKTGKCLRVLADGGNSTTTIIVELKNGTLASGSLKGPIKIWDLNNGKCLRTVEGHTRTISALIELKNGTLVSGSDDGSIKLWDPDSGKFLRKLKGHDDRIRSLIELKDGTLVSGSDDGSIKLWDPDSGKCLCTLKGHEKWIWSLIELKDGSLVSGSEDGTIRIWKGDVEAIESTEAYSSTASVPTSIPWHHFNEQEQQQQQPEQAQQQTASSVTSTSTSTVDPSTLLDLTLQQKLDQFAGVAEATFRAMQKEYEAKGRAFFANLLQEQQEALQKALEAQQAQMGNNLSTQQKELYQRALNDVLKEQRASLANISNEQMQSLQQALNAKIGPQLEMQIQDMMKGQHYQKQMQDLQATLLNQIHQRQTQIVQEVLHTQQEQAQLKDKQSVLYKSYETKQRRLLEQQQLQNPPSVQLFYNTVEKEFSSRLMSAMMLVSGLVQRAELTGEKGSKLASTVVGSLCGGIPIVGNIVGGLVTFGIDEAVGATVDHFQDKKYNNAFDGALRFKDAMALAELAARRVTQSYIGKIQTLTPEKAAKAAENAAQVMYDYLQSGKLKEFANRSVEEKMEALVKAVHMAGESKTGRLKKTGGIFETQIAPTSLTPAAHKQVHAVTRDVHGVKSQMELHAKQTQLTIQSLQKQVQLLQTQTFSRISSIGSDEERTLAVQELSKRVIFTGQQFVITITKKEVTIKGAEEDHLDKIASLLPLVFDKTVLDDCETEDGTLIITASTSNYAKKLEDILRNWLTQI